MNIHKSLDLVVRYFQSGNLLMAEKICRKVLNKRPGNAEALHFLGIICYRKGQYDSAIALIKKALEISPDFADAYNNLGNILQDQKRFKEAVACYKEAFSLKPNTPQTALNLGIALQEEGELDEALYYYRKALALGINNAGIYNNMGLALQKKGRYEEAKTAFTKAITIDHKNALFYFNLGNLLKELHDIDNAIRAYQTAIHLEPDFGEAYNNLGLVFQKKGLIAEAEACCHKAMENNPDLVETYNNLGNLLRETGRREKALDWYRQALQKNPYFSNAYYNLGCVLRELEQLNEARAAFDMASFTNPADLKARWGRCMSYLPMLYRRQADIQTARSRYEKELGRLYEIISLKTPQEREAAADAVGAHQPFYLAYQGFSDRDLQKVYGDLVCRIMGSRYPEYAGNYSLPYAGREGKIHVGVVSGFFYNHSNWKIPIRGWIENLNREKFRLYGYYTGTIEDKETALARTYFDRFTENIDSFQDLCKMLREDNLHVLLYPEIGMDPFTVKVAALRHAPVQCTSWGHPETSGLPTIDYFLSSDLMEPSDASDHYTEELIRLPNLSIYYSPLEVRGIKINRNAYGIGKESVLYLCFQSIYKYLPQYDDLYPRIAQEVGDCKFLFIAHQKSRFVTEEFLARIRRSFTQYSLRADDFIIMLPRLDPEDYHGFNMIAHVYLDTIGWSGCNSTFEAIACDLPVVTLPGTLMRGRHSAAMLDMMDVPETIAHTIDEYIGIAVRLGKDNAWRNQIKEKIRMNKHRIYHDRSCVQALEKFFERVVKRG
ncbi:MAG: tetratricopeptide repeat protein [Nitrospirota bacterium]